MASKESARTLPKGTVLTTISSGGGGWGDPRQRDPEEVWQDVRNGLISVTKARQDYGVVLTNEGLDQEATKNLRSAKGHSLPSPRRNLDEKSRILF